MPDLVARKLRSYNQARQLAAFLDMHYPELRDANMTQIVARLAPARHSADFRSARWFGVTYHFSPSQAVIIRCLWDAWRNGTPSMGAASLIEAADMVSDRVADLFRGHEAWGDMVQSDGKGRYYLVPRKDVAKT